MTEPTGDGPPDWPEQGRFRRWLAPVFLAILSTLAGWHLAGGWALDWAVPLSYDGDGLVHLIYIKRLGEGWWLYHTDAMGAPFGSELYDYPLPSVGSLLFQKLLFLLTGSLGVAYNAFFLLGFPLDALAAYFVSRRLDLSRTFSFVSAFVYTLLPFHFLRTGHLFYTWYFVAPLSIWYAVRACRGELRFTDGGWPTRAGLGDAALLLAISCFGVYNSFFCVLVLLTAGALRCWDTGSVRALRAPVLGAAIVTAGVVASMAPNLAHRIQHGVNREAVQRNAASTELYGLKLTQLLLPHSLHRFSLFARLNRLYSVQFPLVNENSTSSLGLIGSVGFLALLLLALAPRPVAGENRTLRALASLTLVLVLFATIGGLSSLFSMLVAPLIRAWNRVSVFLAFTSISAAMFLAESLVARCAPRPSSSRWGLGFGTLLCALALWDQTPASALGDPEARVAAFRRDQRFFSALEARLPAASMIYQLPYVPFPESLPVNRLLDYELARGYLQSRSLRFSYGSLKGSRADRFFRSLAQRPLREQLEVVRALGFRGVTVDRRGYADDGAAIERELADLLAGPATATSETGEQLFFELGGPGPAVGSGPLRQEPRSRGAPAQ